MIRNILEMQNNVIKVIILVFSERDLKMGFWKKKSDVFFVFE